MASFLDGIFGKSQTQEEKIKEWSSNLKKEARTIDRELRVIERDENKVKEEIKKAAKKGEKSSAIVLAKGLVKSRKTKERMLTAKTNINSVCLEMKNQVAMLKVSGVMSKSTTVMKAMSQIISVPQIQSVMRNMSQEMMKSGLISEMMDDAMEVLDDPELEADADAEVEATLYDITMGQFGAVDAIKNKNLKKVVPEVEENKEEDEELEKMKSRFAKLNA